jgi:hypothetical protein
MRCLLSAKYSGTEVKLEDEDYLVVRENELLAVVAHGRPLLTTLVTPSVRSDQFTLAENARLHRVP